MIKHRFFRRLLFYVRRGMTFVEIMTVMSLLGILMAVAVKTYTDSADTARKSKCFEDIKAISRALKYYLMEDADPAYTLQRMRQGGSVQAGEILKKAGRLSSDVDMLDPWNRYYTLHKVYRNSGMIDFYVGSNSPEMFNEVFDTGFYSILAIDLNDGVPPAVNVNVRGYWVKADELRKM